MLDSAVAGDYEATTVRFHTHLLPTYFPDRDPPFGPYLRKVLEQVTIAEELGWECQWFTEHHFLQYGGPIPNPAVMISAVAARTSRIRLGSAISILPLHHPIQIAEDYAMVDALSGGRLEFGIGRGNTLLDYTMYGIDREESHARLQESLVIIRKAWSQERFSHHGRFWQVDDCTLTPRPEQAASGGPPIWVASLSPDSTRWAGTQGFNVMTVSHPQPPERVNTGVAAWRQALRESGFDPARYLNKLHFRVFVHPDRERAREIAEEAIVNYENLQEARHTGRSPNLTHADYDFQKMLDEGRNIYGNPEDCIRLIQTAQRHFDDFDICSTTFNFGGIPFEDVLASMRLFAKEVMPAFAEPSAFSHQPSAPAIGGS